MKVDGKFREVESAARLAFSKMTGCGAGATAASGGWKTLFQKLSFKMQNIDLLRVVFWRMTNRVC